MNSTIWQITWTWEHIFPRFKTNSQLHFFLHKTKSQTRDRPKRNSFGDRLKDFQPKNDKFVLLETLIFFFYLAAFLRSTNSSSTQNNFQKQLTFSVTIWEEQTKYFLNFTFIFFIVSYNRTVLTHFKSCKM